MSLSYALCRLRIKEFTDIAQTGFGLDGDEKTKHLDFKAVRGTPEEDGFILKIKKHTTRKTEPGNELIERIRALC